VCCQSKLVVSFMSSHDMICRIVRSGLHDSTSRAKLFVVELYIIYELHISVCLLLLSIQLFFKLFYLFLLVMFAKQKLALTSV
jgi:hypothetical protein